MKGFFKITGIVLGVILVLLVALITKIPRIPFEKTEHFARWESEIAKQQFVPDTGAFEVGWAKTNITPSEPGPMAGYGKRWGKPFSSVHDSLYIRSIAIKNANSVISYLVAADLLIVPPNVTLRLQQLLNKDNISLQNVHLGAIHSHHSRGAWGRKIAGYLFGGSFDEEVEKELAEKIHEAILNSSKNMLPATIKYAEEDDVENVRNRLKIEDGETDPWIRMLLFERSDSSRAQMVSFSAHATNLESMKLEISRDYPGALVDSLEQNEVDFAMFMAGAVASMGSSAVGDDGQARVNAMASGITKEIRDSIDFSAIKLLGDSLYSGLIELPLPEPGMRISKNFALRPWAFKAFMGDYTNYIKVTKIGNALLIGLPVDFSGEIMRRLDRYAESKGIQLIVTSFNGGYIGYITDDRLYDRDLYETMTMSWNGFQSGGYFEKVIRDIVDKF